MANAPDSFAVCLFEKRIYFIWIVNENSAVFLCFFVVELCECFCWGCSYADRDADFFCNSSFEVVADFVIFFDGPVTFIEEKKGFID